MEQLHSFLIKTCYLRIPHENAVLFFNQSIQFQREQEAKLYPSVGGEYVFPLESVLKPEVGTSFDWLIPLPLLFR